MVQTTKRTTRSSKSSKRRGRSKSSTKLTLAQAVQKAVQQKYKVTIQSRGGRIQKKIWYACREKLGYDVSAQVKKDGRSFNASNFWKQWNGKVFPALFGDVEEPKYSAIEMATMMGQLYDTVSSEPEQALVDLLEYNQESLKRRNGNGDNGIDEEEFDEDEEEDDLLEDEEDDFDDDDEEEFEADELLEEEEDFDDEEEIEY